MTVRLEATIKRYIGISTDAKPVPGQVNPDGYTVLDKDLPPGSSFLATDTNEVWHWNGREWVIGESPEVRELKAIQGLLGAILEKVTPGF